MLEYSLKIFFVVHIYCMMLNVVGGSRAMVTDSAKSRAPERASRLPPGQSVRAAAAGVGAPELQGLQPLPTGSLYLQGPQGAQDQGRGRVPGQLGEALCGNVPVSIVQCGGGLGLGVGWVWVWVGLIG